MLADSPDTRVQTTIYSNQEVYVAVCAMRGWRESMEDFCTVDLSPVNDRESMVFGVFDGHGGKDIAEYLSTNLLDDIINSQVYQRGKVSPAIIEAFTSTDQMMHQHESEFDRTSGSTATILIIRNKILYFANTGDSRAIGCFSSEIKQITRDHKPDDPLEKIRITQAGHHVIQNRVDGVLAMSRCFGDFDFKSKRNVPAHKQAVICNPDIIMKRNSKEIQFILMASDGVFDCISSQGAGHHVIVQMQQGNMPEAVLYNLFKRCLATPDSEDDYGDDNMSAILIIFKNNVHKDYSKLLSRSPKFALRME